MPDAPSSRWSDLGRPALDGPALAAALTRDSELWQSLEVVEEVGSTNAQLLAAAAADAPEGTVLVAEHQASGRGRLDRIWISPPRAGLTVSVLLRPDVPVARRGWLTLLTGVALVIGLVIWIVLWALGSKADDAFLPLVVLILIGAAVRLTSPYINDKLKP